MNAVRRLAIVAFVLAAACASTPPAPPVVVPPAPVDVAPVASGPSPDFAAMKAKAEEAVGITVKKMHDIAQRCAAEWLETETACPKTEFASIAADYQAYYSEQPDPRHEEGSLYSLPRLGGPTRSVEQLIDDLVQGCEDGCRSARTESVGSAVDEAAEACSKLKTGYGPCHELQKKLAKSMRASEVEHWTERCESHCEAPRAHARYEAEIDAKRPKTKAAAIACQNACRAKYEGDWCGTPLLACLRRCTPKGEAIPFP
jgi:hypothetical protein